VSANGVFRSAEPRFAPEFPEHVAALAAKVFEIGLLERFGVVTFLCCPLSREALFKELLAEELLEISGLEISGLEISGLEISGMSAGLRGKFVDDSWYEFLVRSLGLDQGWDATPCTVSRRLETQGKHSQLT
jgi:hypothetical protein